MSKPRVDLLGAKAFFKGRKIVIATKHKKEHVIAPQFDLAFETHSLVPTQLDTDQFGTFTGEVERKTTAYEAARLKIKTALELTGETLGIASEGSFGPHPQIGFVPADEEMVLLIDTLNNFEISATKISTAINYAHQQCTRWEEVRIVAIDSGFPSHALILKTKNAFLKGITTWPSLESGYHELKKEFPFVIAETDMRAMHNPTRMKVIEEVTALLIDKVNSLCPNCAYPGFAVADKVAGLPCGDCGHPTQFSLKHIYKCVHCGHLVEKLFPEGPVADPMYCLYCNP
ncbi:MAG: DUF6671 family protein [Flammeovirgaceae bacterium]